MFSITNIWQRIFDRYGSDPEPPKQEDKPVRWNNPNKIPGEVSPAEVLYNPPPAKTPQHTQTPIQEWLYENFPSLTEWVDKSRTAGTVIEQQVSTKLDSIATDITEWSPLGDLKNILFYASIIVGTGAVIYFAAVIRSSLR